MKIIDLTLQIHEGMSVYPGDPKVEIAQIQTLNKHGWNMKRIHINGHDGTHVNMPIHCVKNGKTLDDFKIENFCGDCVLYNDDLDIQKDVGVIFKKQINMRIAELIVKIKPKFVGLSIEIDEELEKYLLKHEIILFERLINVDKLPSKFIFYGVPLTIKNGDGSPIRAFAIID